MRIDTAELRSPSDRGSLRSLRPVTAALGGHGVRIKAIEAYRILNDFVGDLVAGTRGLEIFELPGFASQIGANTQLVLRRMCLSHLVVTLSRWSELYDRYISVTFATSWLATSGIRS